MNTTQRTYRRGRRAVLLVVTVALLLVLAACGAIPGQDSTAGGDVVEVFSGDLAANATASGALEPRRSASLQADVPARVTEVFVREGQPVEAGEPLVALDTTDLELNLAAAEQNVRLQEAALAELTAPPTAAELAAAEATVASAQAALDDLQNGPSEAELAALEASVASAQAGVASAAADVQSVAGQVTAADVTAAEAALTSAQIQLTNAEEANRENTNQATHQALLAAQQAYNEAKARVDDLRAGADTDAAQSSLGAAQARRESSQADFERQTAPPSAAQLAAAEAQLADAQASLDDLQSGPTQTQIAAAEAELAQARIALEDALAALADATITAPFAGTVAAVNVQPGEIAGGPVLELVDLSSLEAVLSVDEVDIGSLAVGQPAEITLETWPDAPLEATVTAIAPAATADASGLVTYEVRVALPETDLPALAGMTANASLITQEKQDVLLVESSAISVDRSAGTYTVRRVTGTDDAGQPITEEVEITIGLRDGRYTEVLSGLEAGDQVLVNGIAPPVNDGGVGGPFGGGEDEE